MKDPVVWRLVRWLYASFYIVALASLLASTTLAAQPVHTLRDQLVGTWRLVSATQVLADGSSRPDPRPGPRGVGYIMYGATGHMCVVLANPDRPAWEVAASPSDREVRTALDGLVAYCGTYNTNEQEHYVVHHVEADSEPPIMGTDRKRFVTITGKQLVLRPAVLPAGVKAWTVEFERVER